MVKCNSALLRLYQGQNPELPPLRDPDRDREDAAACQVLMHEFDAVKNEIQTALSNQVAVLSFGAATVGLLVAGGAEVWAEASGVVSVLFMFAVPLVCILTLAVFAGEQVRLMRAGLFIRMLERHLALVYERPDDNLLTWESWGKIRQGFAHDVDTQARAAVGTVFVTLALIFAGVGFWQAMQSSRIAAVALLLLLTIVSSVSLAWVFGRFVSATAFRKLYPDYESRSCRPDAAGAGKDWPKGASLLRQPLTPPVLVLTVGAAIAFFLPNTYDATPPAGEVAQRAE